MRKLIILLLGVALMFTLTACGEKGYTNITNEELQTMMNSSDDYQFLDVRTSSEYYDERIPEFDINLDFYIFEDDYSILDRLDKNIPIIIMCNSGNRSVSAAKIMVDEGFIEIYNLTNGIQGWNGETE